MVRAGTEPAVERLADAVQAAVRVGSEERGSGVAPPGREDHLGRAEQFGAADHRSPVGEGVRKLFVVAAPGQVGGPDPAVAVTEAGGAGGEQQRGVVSGAAVPAGAHPGALLDGPPLRVPFPAPAPGQVQEFDGVRSHREDGGQFVELEGRGAGVGDGVAQFQQAAVVQDESGFDGDAGVGILLDDYGGVAVNCGRARARRRTEKSRPETPSAIRWPAQAPAGHASWRTPAGAVRPGR